MKGGVKGAKRRCDQASNTSFNPTLNDSCAINTVRSFARVNYALGYGMTSAFEAMIFALGFAGIVSYSFVPFRGWQLVAKGELAHFLRSGPIAMLLGISAACLFFWCSYVGASSLPRLFTCLMGKVCGQNRAHGLILLAIFGGYSLVFELTIFAARWIATRAQPIIQAEAATPRR